MNAVHDIVVVLNIIVIGMVFVFSVVFGVVVVFVAITPCPCSSLFSKVVLDI